MAVEQGPHKIPLIFVGDVILGLKTTFPRAARRSGEFDPELARRTARAAAVEASAKGIHWIFAPLVDVVRDQRWGRVVDGAGEDSWLGAQFTAARVRGFQGDDLTAEDAVLACPKHFAGYGASAVPDAKIAFECAAPQRNDPVMVSCPRSRVLCVIVCSRH